MIAVERLQTFQENDGSFDLSRTRLWLDEYSALASASAPITDLEIADEVIATEAGNVMCRFYAPGLKPTVLFVHGGGWAIGSIQTHDHIARWIAKEAQCRVVSVEYSLAPENPYPRAIEECSAVLMHLASEKGHTGQPLFVAGDSAGANLGAMAILDVPENIRKCISGFVSIYGAYAPEMNLSSHKLYGDGRFGISEAQMRWFWNLYAPHIAPGQRGKLSPLEADLAHFPPTLCIGAECDLLLDDTLAFYSSLTSVCEDVTLSLWPSLPHGCMHFVGVVDSVTSAASSISSFIETRCEAAKQSGPRTPQAAGESLSVVSPAITVSVGSGYTGILDVEPLFVSTRSRLHGSLAHRIATDIFTGRYETESLLPREDIASATYSVSRSAYREAIRTLAAKGLVTALPKVGTRIAPRSNWRILDPDLLAWYFETSGSESFIRNLFELRKIVEPSAAALTAMRRSNEDLGELAGILARMARAGANTGAWMNATMGFHEKLLLSCGNEAVASLWPPIQTKLRWSLKLQMMLPELELARDPIAEHARVYEKIEREDANGALAEMALLVDTALNDTLSNLRRVSQTAPVS